MAKVATVKRAVQPPKAGGKLEIRLPRIPADARTFFVISLLAYVCHDFVLRPLLHWLLSLLWH